MPENTIISSSANYYRQLEQNQQRLQTETSRATQADEALISKDSSSEPVKTEANLAKEAQTLTLDRAQQVRNLQLAAETQSSAAQQYVGMPTTASAGAQPGEASAGKTSVDGLPAASPGLSNSLNVVDGTRASTVGNDRFNDGGQQSRGTLIDIFS